MADGWVTLQLQISEENLNEAQLRKDLQAKLPGLEVFLPMRQYKDKRGTYSYALFDGYVFVRGEFSDREYFKLADCAQVMKVLTYSTRTDRKAIAFTPNEKIEQMKAQLRSMVPDGFGVGDDVSIIKGLYSGLKGKIINEVDEGNVLVELRMPMGSLTKLTSIAKMFLSKDEG
jgi:transcription antitermination factor NusG